MERLVFVSFVTLAFAACGGDVEPAPVDSGVVDAPRDVPTVDTPSCDSAAYAPVDCADGTGRHDCCPFDVTAMPCCDPTLQCRTRCSSAGYSSRYYCSGGTWLAGLGLFPCDSP